ncbi:hypothetical protein HZZ00_36665 [Streptomyces sp. NEAU-sy36]|uniref:hypothetical protein n=1 Tax=unclassified Streptomyces TaxID=2593676 RepID=UPI0015D59A20|nr:MULTISPECIES: hypothetical protein [unclassified Streptomyces]QLI99609.1 hypothetical protein HZZ00_00540 [Streptomyces sp. NEAU-sy36]QLJ06002.1 hypothetical protein HZZ00_36665 [Streptomyces sp. NEAU-sy36]
MPGTVLLLAAAPLGRGRLVDAASVLPVLAAVAPAVLSGTDTANVVELADPVDPQGVLTRLRAAAAAPGPLTVYLTGQLHLDRRQRLPHLALARTTPATVRYTALPWHWIREELRLRPPGQTALLLDLHADPEAWRHLHEQPLDAGRTAAVYGRVAPPPGRRGPAEPTYMKTVATLLRSGHRPPLDELHHQALARIAEETSVNVLLGPPQVAAYAGPGWTGPAVPAGGFGAVADAGHPGGYAGTGAIPGPRTDAPDAVPAGGSGPVSADAVRPDSGAAADAGDVAGDAGVAGPAEPGAGGGPGDDARAEGSAAPPPAPADGLPEAGGDPHVAISDAVRDGRHEEADAIAARLQEAAVGEHGPASEDALHWAEVRADLAMFAGDAGRSCRGWMTVAETRLAAGQAPDAPAVEAAVDRAHHQWGRIGDTARARELGPALAELRSRVPGRRQGALEDVRRQLRELQRT